MEQGRVSAGQAWVDSWWQACAACGSADATLRCSACKAARYCSKECQKAHWKGHKAVCKQLRAEKQ